MKFRKKYADGDSPKIKNGRKMPPQAIQHFWLLKYVLLGEIGHFESQNPFYSFLVILLKYCSRKIFILGKIERGARFRDFKRSAISLEALRGTVNACLAAAVFTFSLNPT